MLTNLTIAQNDIYLIRDATSATNRTINGDGQPANHPISVAVTSCGMRVMDDVMVYAMDITIDTPDDHHGPIIEAYLTDCRRTAELSLFTGYAVSKRTLVRRAIAHARLHRCPTVDAPYGSVCADSVIASFLTRSTVPDDDRVRVPMTTAPEYDAVPIDPATVDRYMVMYADVPHARMIDLGSAQHIAWIVMNVEHAANARIPRLYDVIGLDAGLTSDDGCSVVEFFIDVVGDGVSSVDGHVRLDHSAVITLVDNAQHNFGEAGDGHVELIDADTHRYEMWFGGDAYEITPVY